MFTLTSINKQLNDPKLSVMNFLNEITIRYPDSISFAPGRPKEEYFDVSGSFSYIDVYLKHMNEENKTSMDYSNLGQYGDTKGIIRNQIKKLLFNDQKIHIDSEDILITVGCQEAMTLSLLALAAEENDVILVEDPSYVGITGIAKTLGIEVVGVPTSSDGIDVSALATILDDLRFQKKNAKMLYLSPDFSNPNGFTTSQEARKELLNVTRNHSVIVLEDHAYNYFYYDDTPNDCLKSMDNSDHVIYLGSFSKSVYPGLRIGFMAANQKIKTSSDKLLSLADELSKIKSYITVNTPSLNQAIIGGLIIEQNYSLISYTQSRRDFLKSNKKTIMDALSLFFPKNDPASQGIHWNEPDGGFFITLNLPFSVSNSQLYTCINEYDVIWCPMSYFGSDEKGGNSLRLSFSYLDKESIIEGVRRLSEFVKKQIKITNQL